MKTFILGLIVAFSIVPNQKEQTISVIDFVQVQNENYAEAEFYYINNWMELRKLAVKKGYIKSFQFLKTPYSEEAPFNLMLITTYPSIIEYKKSEENFQKLIKAQNGLTLLNEKQPKEFRKVLFSKTDVIELQ